MPRIHHATREIQFKIVYYGPGLGGKTTNVEYIHRQSNPAHRGKLVSMATESERTLFFDLLPVDLGKFKDYSIRIHLCTVPGQLARDDTRKLVLRNVDGIVFVVDSQEARIDANVASLRNLEANLLLQGDDPSRIPLVIQYNKRDLPTAMSRTALRSELAIPAGARQIDACAAQGVGVFETFKAITKACMKVVGDPSEKPEGRSTSVLPAPKHSSMFPLASLGPLTEDAARDHAARLGLELPKPPRLPRVGALP
jgi:signal recognition particle receptor subunit beta